jgi:hypothetical protein
VRSSSPRGALARALDDAGYPEVPPEAGDSDPV